MKEKTVVCSGCGRHMLIGWPAYYHWTDDTEKAKVYCPECYRKIRNPADSSDKEQQGSHLDRRR